MPPSWLEVPGVPTGLVCPALTVRFPLEEKVLLGSRPPRRGQTDRSHLFSCDSIKRVQSGLLHIASTATCTCDVLLTIEVSEGNSHTCEFSSDLLCEAKHC